jgi:hypothetical protein
MKRRGKFERKYQAFASTVLSSIGRVGAAGRTGDPVRIDAARRLMVFVRAQLGLA